MMNKDRLLAFTDGVLAIIITIMVLELKVPEDPSYNSLLALYPTFISYVLSFIYVGLYWYNHHLLFHNVKKINSKILWFNMLGLFWQSLIPFASDWMAESAFASQPVSLYAIILALSVASHILLSNEIKAVNTDVVLYSSEKKAKQRNILSLIINSLCAILALFGFNILAIALLFIVAFAWFRN